MDQYITNQLKHNLLYIRCGTYV